MPKVTVSHGSSVSPRLPGFSPSLPPPSLPSPAVFSSPLTLCPLLCFLSLPPPRMWLYVWQGWGGRDDNYWVIQPILLCFPDVLIHPKWKSLISPNPQHVGSFKASGFPGERKSVPIVGACNDCRGRVWGWGAAEEAKNWGKGWWDSVL